MKKINIIKENREYNRIIQSQKPYKTQEYLIYIERDQNNHYQFGFSIGKKICNAVGRNKIKRQLKSIIDQKDYQNDFNCIIMVRKSILNRTYQDMEKSLLDAFSKLKILKEKSNESKK